MVDLPGLAGFDDQAASGPHAGGDETVVHGGGGQQGGHGGMAFRDIPVGENQQAGAGLHLPGRIAAQRPPGRGSTPLRPARGQQMDRSADRRSSMLDPRMAARAAGVRMG
jgi:hypothetical protein